MIQLILYELKKIFKNKAIVPLLLGIIIIPPFFVPELDKKNRSTMTIDQNGVLIPQYQKLEQEDMEYANYTGDLLDDTFFQKVEEDYVKNQFLEKIDPKKIEAYYGRTLTYNELYQKIDTLDERFFYDTEEEYRLRNGYSSSVIYRIYHLRKNLEEYYQSYHTNKYGTSANFSKRVQLIEERTYQRIASLEHLYVGRTLAFEKLFSTLNIVAFVLSFFFLMLFPSIVNKEGNVFNLIQTTKQGKRKLLLAKIFSMMLLAILIPLICTLFTTLVIHLRYGLHSFKISAMLMSSHYLFYSVLTLFIKRLFLMILGCFALGVLGLFVSSVLKSSYISLGVMIVFYLIWMFTPSHMEALEWKTFTPMNILLDSGRHILESDPFYFGNHLWELELLVYLVWIVVATVLCYVSYVMYQKRQLSND